MTEQTDDLRQSSFAAQDTTYGETPRNLTTPLISLKGRYVPTLGYVRNSFYHKAFALCRMMDVGRDQAATEYHMAHKTLVRWVKEYNKDNSDEVRGMLKHKGDREASQHKVLMYFIKKELQAGQRASKIANLYGVDHDLIATKKIQWKITKETVQKPAPILKTRKSVKILAKAQNRTKGSVPTPSVKTNGYTPEFICSSILKYRTEYQPSGRSLKILAEDLKIPRGTVSRWVWEYRNVSSELLMSEVKVRPYHYISNSKRINVKKDEAPAEETVTFNLQAPVEVPELKSQASEDDQERRELREALMFSTQALARVTSLLEKRI